MRIMTTDVKNHIGKKINLIGWIAQIRDLKNIKFVLLRDVSGTVQIVILKNHPLFKEITKIPFETVVSIKGSVSENKQAKSGYEVILEKMDIISKCNPVLPVDVAPKTTSKLDTRIDYKFLDARRPEVSAIFKIRSTVFSSAVRFFDENGFLYINTPKLTILGLESGAQLFEVNYFKKKVYLAQSPQLYKQMFAAGCFEKVYEIAPVFRAESSHTTRHLTEFTGIDFEMSFIKDETDVINITESLLKYIIAEIKDKRKHELNILNVNLQIPDKIPRIEMNQMKQWLRDEHNKDISEDDDLDSEAEKLSAKIIKDKLNSDVYFLTDFPFASRPFYTMKKGSKSTRSFDLVYNGVELATGSQREHRIEILKKQAQEKDINFKAMKEYADIFIYGCPPHGGVGMGLDRIIQQILNLSNVREAVLLPRDPERISP